MSSFPVAISSDASADRLPDGRQCRVVAVPSGLADGVAVATYNPGLDFTGYADKAQLALPIAGTGKTPVRRRRRAPIQQRFLDGGAASLDDGDFLTLVLSQAMPETQARRHAGQLLANYGSANHALSADRLDPGIAALPEAVGMALAITRAAAVRLARAEIIGREVLSSWDKVIDYCRVRLAHLGHEEFHVLYLDRRNRLIADEAHQRGSVDHTPVYPREVARRGLLLQASAIVMLHNHPSGDPTPSRGDIEMTKQVRDALATLGMVLHDHVVIAGGGHASFKSLGLL
jgi:DNA repair protein RadC